MELEHQDEMEFGFINHKLFSISSNIDNPIDSLKFLLTDEHRCNDKTMHYKHMLAPLKKDDDDQEVIQAPFPQEIRDY